MNCIIAILLDNGQERWDMLSEIKAVVSTLTDPIADNEAPPTPIATAWR